MTPTICIRCGTITAEDGSTTRPRGIICAAACDDVPLTDNLVAMARSEAGALAVACEAAGVSSVGLGCLEARGGEEKRRGHGLPPTFGAN